MIKIRDLEYLDAVDTHKHFGKAAESCHVSQPTLSGQIIKLEEQLGITLIERHHRKIMLTPVGEQLLCKARKVLLEAQELEVMAKSLGDPLSGEIHLGLIPTLAPYLLPCIMPSLISNLPKLDIFLHENQTENLLKSLDDGKLDALILPWLDGMEQFEAYDLFEEPFLLAVNKDNKLAKKKVVSLADLKGREVLTLEDGHCLRDQALGHCFSAGADENKRFQATSLETLRYMVASGIGITLLPELSTLDQKDRLGVCYIPFKEAELKRRVVILVRQNYTRLECIRKIVSVIRTALNEGKIV